MDKTGYLRVLEAVIAVVAIFGFTLFIMPKATEDVSKTPEPVQQTMQAVLNQIDSDPVFRYSVLVGDDCTITKDNTNKNGWIWIKDFLDQNIPGGENSVWSYKFSICKNEENDKDCVFVLETTTTPPLYGTISSPPEDFKKAGKDKNVYSKNTYVTVADVSGDKPQGIEICTNIKARILTLYFWEK